eukprot:gene41781-14174_t
MFGGAAAADVAALFGELPAHIPLQTGVQTPVQRGAQPLPEAAAGDGPGTDHTALPPTATVGDARRAAAAAVGLHPHPHAGVGVWVVGAVCLAYGGERLRDDAAALAELGIGAEATLEVIDALCVTV